jgi:hypothetical protein
MNGEIGDMCKDLTLPQQAHLPATPITLPQRLCSRVSNFGNEFSISIQARSKTPSVKGVQFGRFDA